MNETLRRALFRARLSEEDVASRLAVDPKTVRRWIEGRVPYPRHRWALAAMLQSNERDLWPGLTPEVGSASIPSEDRCRIPPQVGSSPRDLVPPLQRGAAGDRHPGLQQSLPRRGLRPARRHLGKREARSYRPDRAR